MFYINFVLQFYLNLFVYSLCIYCAEFIITFSVFFIYIMWLDFILVICLHFIYLYVIDIHYTYRLFLTIVLPEVFVMVHIECCRKTETAIYSARTNLPVLDFQTWQVWCPSIDSRIRRDSKLVFIVVGMKTVMTFIDISYSCFANRWNNDRQVGSYTIFYFSIWNDLILTDQKMWLFNFFLKKS